MKIDGHRQRGRDRRQVLQRIERQRLHAGQDGDGGVARPHQRVAVGGCLGDLVGADGARIAGDVLDHHRLAPGLREFLGEHAAGDVGGAAGGEADHHRTGRVGQATCALAGWSAAMAPITAVPPAKRLRRVGGKVMTRLSLAQFCFNPARAAGSFQSAWRRKRNGFAAGASIAGSAETQIDGREATS